MSGIKGVIFYQPKTKETTFYVHDGEGEVPTLVVPKIEPKRRRGRPRKDKAPEVS